MFLNTCNYRNALDQILNDMTLLLHGQTRSDQCFGTPASATTLLLRGQAHFDQCFGTPASATTLLIRG